jgi:hypothetical protein
MGLPLGSKFLTKTWPCSTSSETFFMVHGMLLFTHKRCCLSFSVPPLLRLFERVSLTAEKHRQATGDWLGNRTSTLSPQRRSQAARRAGQRSSSAQPLSSPCWISMVRDAPFLLHLQEGSSSSPRALMGSWSGSAQRGK